MGEVSDLQCPQRRTDTPLSALTMSVYHNTLQRRLLRLEAMLDIPLDDRSPPVPGLRQAKKRVMKGDKLSGSEDWHGQGDTGKKSIWRASDGGEISVEGLALECYEREGWKGFHSENGILTTIVSSGHDGVLLLHSTCV